MKTIKYILTFLLLVFHVHLSAFTIENPINPLFFIILTAPAFGIHERLAYYVGGIVIQSIVTCILAICLLKRKNWKYWLMSFCALALIVFMFQNILPFNINNIIAPFSSISAIYEDIYYMDVFPYIIKFSIIQILLLLLYQVTSYTATCIKRS